MSAARRSADLPPVNRRRALGGFVPLRDTVSSHAGLREAISITAKVAPKPIRAEVQLLSARAEREPLTRALRQFAAELDDPVNGLQRAAAGCDNVINHDDLRAGFDRAFNVALSSVALRFLADQKTIE